MKKIRFYERKRAYLYEKNNCAYNCFDMLRCIRHRESLWTVDFIAIDILRLIVQLQYLRVRLFAMFSVHLMMNNIHDS